MIESKRPPDQVEIERAILLGDAQTLLAVLRSIKERKVKRENERAETTSMTG